MAFVFPGEKWVPAVYLVGKVGKGGGAVFTPDNDAKLGTFSPWWRAAVGGFGQLSGKHGTR